MVINDILTSDPLFKNKKKVKHETLNGCLLNDTYLVICEGEKYVVKINNAQNKYLKLDYHSEVQVQQKAAEMRIAPMMLSDIGNKAYSISECPNGHLLAYEEMIQSDTINEFAEVIRQLHSIEGVNRTCSIFDLIDGYVRGIKEFKVKIPSGYHEVMMQTEKIRARREKDKENNDKYCHNNLMSCNIFIDNHKIYIIGWELSGIGDPYIDLATIPYRMNFSIEKEKLLLEAYFGYYEDEMLIHLRDMRYIGLVRECVWALFFEGLRGKRDNGKMNYYEAGCYALNRIKKGYLSM